ncbi:hypothetical protein BC828DRAFT_221953 [Blastocladiella britannica]|nr:hypothetical protein BC828DRAFT_221953 [Blastocladiella britannica]
MEASLDQVARHCGFELAAFQDCLDKTNHPKNCERARIALNVCTDAKVPSVRLLRLRCDAQNRAFAECLQANPNAPHLCEDKLGDFYHCARQVAAEVAALEKMAPADP